MLCACPCSGAFKALHRGAIPLWTPGGSGLHAGAVEVCQWLHASNSHHRISGTSQSNQQIKQQTHNHITGSQIYDLSSHLILLEQSTKSFLLVAMRIDCAVEKPSVYYFAGKLQIWVLSVSICLSPWHRVISAIWVVSWCKAALACGSAIKGQRCEWKSWPDSNPCRGTSSSMSTPCSSASAETRTTTTGRPSTASNRASE